MTQRPPETTTTTDAAPKTRTRAPLPHPAPRIDVHGHRGARAVRPENTLAAMRYALDVGVDVLEFDLGVTRDDRLVLAHDPVLDPTLCQHVDGRPLDTPMPVRAHTLAELSALDCGSLRNPRFPRQEPVPGEPLPTLEQVFALVRDHPRGATVGFNIETKIQPGHPEQAPDPETFARLVIEAVRAAGVVERTLLQSFDRRTLQAARNLEPTLRRSLLTEGEPADPLALCEGVGAVVWSPHHAWVSPETVRRMHDAGIEVAPWTANEPAVWARLRDAGVDAIITDDPAGLLAFLAP